MQRCRLSPHRDQHRYRPTPREIAGEPEQESGLARAGLAEEDQHAAPDGGAQLACDLRVQLLPIDDSAGLDALRGNGEQPPGFLERIAQIAADRAPPAEGNQI